MAIEKFAFEKLATINGGRLRSAWDHAFERARHDCYDRDGLEEKRRVILVATLTPRRSSNGSDEPTVDVEFEVDDKLPKRRSHPMNMKMVRGALIYNEMSPDDVNQLSLDEPGPRSAKGGTHAG